MRKTLSVHDSCGVHNLHGIPGIMSGIATAVAAVFARIEEYGNEYVRYMILCHFVYISSNIRALRMCLVGTISENSQPRSQARHKLALGPWNQVGEQRER